MADMALTGKACGLQVFGQRQQRTEHRVNILAPAQRLSPMSDPTPPTIDPVAAQRWERGAHVQSPWLHEEVGRRMVQRLDCIKSTPPRWVHWHAGRGGWQTQTLLQQRYPQAHCTVLETSPRALSQARQVLRTPWWQPGQWFKPRVDVVNQLATPVQLVWSNMALHMAANPQQLMRQWLAALDVDGFLMFSCLGPDTLKELRALYQRLNWPAPAHDFTDMHDWGDLLISVGFAEPVLDVERIVLSFETPERLLQELRGLGRNLHPARFPALRARQWHRQLLQALGQQPLQLTFEVVYGHAVKPRPKPGRAADQISLADLRRALAQGRAAVTGGQGTAAQELNHE